MICRRSFSCGSVACRPEPTSLGRYAGSLASSDLNSRQEKKMMSSRKQSMRGVRSISCSSIASSAWRPRAMSAPSLLLLEERELLVTLGQGELQLPVCDFGEHAVLHELADVVPLGPLVGADQDGVVDHGQLFLAAGHRLHVDVLGLGVGLEQQQQALEPLEVVAVDLGVV